MRLSTLHVRHFKAFNYDYLRRFHKRSKPHPWEEMEDGAWYPFVDVSLETDITTIVGANESGKSQVLDAIEIALGQRAVGRTDFCRYSRHFLVDGSKQTPDFGATFKDLLPEESTKVVSILGLSDSEDLGTFTLVRFGTGKKSAYIRKDGEWFPIPLNAEKARRLDAILPRTFRLKSELALPNTVPLAFLAAEVASSAPASSSRRTRAELLEALAQVDSSIFADKTSVSTNASLIAELFSGLLSDSASASAEQHQLADDLLVRIAGVDRAHFADLAATIAEERDGYVDGVETLINRTVATALNFRKWWSQDRSFQLRVTVRESDLAFIVEDRTGTHYSFSERSGGLSHFLSYFVQYLRHQPSEDRNEILLMDEPDAFLSSQAQKDLLRIFDAFARPYGGHRGCQVVYVTHSPFLIDKNHAERIRVLEKGDGDEGTRVVADVGRNHYEPLRSAFGGSVAETTFMGTCNLLVEGISDQVLIAGMTRRLQAVAEVPPTEYLDLNDLTIVPCGGASQVPYLAYLARGRDVEKPAVIALLDSDDAGAAARKGLRRGGAYGKRLVDDDLVVQVGDETIEVESDRPDGPAEIEDLVPLEIALKAAELYAHEFLGVEDCSISAEGLTAEIGVLSAVSARLREQVVLGSDDDGATMDKVGFARCVLSIVDTDAGSGDDSVQKATDRLDRNFRHLCKKLGAMQRLAVRETFDQKLSERVARVRDAFVEDHQSAPTRAEVQIFFEEIEHVLDESPESEDIRSELRRLSTVHELPINPATSVENYDALVTDLMSVQYRSRQKSQESDLAKVDE